jgi:hypothetical protein
MKRYRLLAAGMVIGLAVTACASATRQNLHWSWWRRYREDRALGLPA